VFGPIVSVLLPLAPTMSRWWPAGERNPRQVLVLLELLRMDGDLNGLEFKNDKKFSMVPCKADTIHGEEFTNDTNEKISMAHCKDNNSTIDHISEKISMAEYDNDIMICMASGKDEKHNGKEFVIDNTDKISKAHRKDEHKKLDDNYEKISMLQPKGSTATSLDPIASAAGQPTWAHACNKDYGTTDSDDTDADSNGTAENCMIPHMDDKPDGYELGGDKLDTTNMTKCKDDNTEIYDVSEKAPPWNQTDLHLCEEYHKKVEQLLSRGGRPTRRDMEAFEKANERLDAAGHSDYQWI
jgi:hypothetical protein